MKIRCSIVAIVLLLTSFAWAGPEAEQQAAELKHQGDAFLSQKSFVDALAAYDKSYALYANPALHYNRGRALQFLARYPESLESLERFDSQAPAELKARVPGLAELIAEVRSKVASVQVLCAVAGGRVLIGGREVGRTPLVDPVKINAGSVSVEIVAEGYLPWRRDIDAKGGAVTDVDVTLVSRSTFGSLVVRSHVEGSRVFVDGRGLGLVPAETLLGAGSHPVVVAHDGYSNALSQVVMRPGDQRSVLLDPLKLPSLASRWWFWTIIGAVVVSVALPIVIVIANTEGSAPMGTIPPYQIRAP